MTTQPDQAWPSSQFNPAQRERAWQRMSQEQFDVVIIGGGVVGAGAALDAASRGLTVALVEARDLASGTSSRSSKLFHGGLRYLEQLDFSLVKEALTERELMLTRLAPHLVKPVKFMYPLKHRGWERPYVEAGLTLYDTMGGARSVPWHKHLTRAQALRMAPGLRRDSLIGAVTYYDGQSDDARHTMMVARTAARYGAVVRMSTEVIRLVQDAGRVVGVEVADVDSDERRTTTIRAGVVVNCTGVWTDEVQQLTGGRGKFRVRASKGVHLIVPRDKISLDVGLILRTEKSVLFVIPWGRHWLIGTTDTDWNLDLAHPAASASDIDYLLEHVNRVLAVPLTHDDIQGVYAGLRPLLAGESEQTSQLSREHAVAAPQPGLVAIAGGKYTTYRVMAADAIDQAVRDLPGSIPASVTDALPLVGADGYRALVNQADRLAKRYGLHVHRVQHLLNRYGSLVSDLFALLDARPELAQPIPGADDYLQVEAVYAVTAEGALHLEDVLTRRTRISIETDHRGVDSARPVAELIAGELGWDVQRIDHEVEFYLKRVEAERDSQASTDDATADAKRLMAPDVRREMQPSVGRK